MEKKKWIYIIVIGVLTIFCAVILIGICLLKIIFSDNNLTPNQIFERNIHCVVEVKALNEEGTTSFGTAEFIDDDGRLITNAHVVTYTKLGYTYTYEVLSIRFADEDEYRAVKLIKYDKDVDLALLQMEDSACSYQVIEMGVSADLRSGDTVYAMGNAMNYGLSISAGIIGIPLIKIDYAGTLRDVVQCDLTIAEGNSGGALLDEQGRLVGLTTFRIKDAMGDVVYGIAYCVPIDVVKDFLSIGT